ncbi:MAG: hypothetical protein K6G88_03165 [Lachnospiraceae bacterium]|nr:hypothetical protein [Lachnospiraceae bacterium]
MNDVEFTIIFQMELADCLSEADDVLYEKIVERFYEDDEMHFEIEHELADKYGEDKAAAAIVRYCDLDAGEILNRYVRYNEEDIYIDGYDYFGTVYFAVPCKFDVEAFAMDFIEEDDDEDDKDEE